MQKILVPFDFSPASKRAYKFSLEIASTVGAEVSVLHIKKPISLYLKILNRYLDFANDISARMQASLAPQNRFENFSKHIEKKNVPVSFLTKFGKLDKALPMEVIVQNADLVVMGTRGANGLKELLLGSNTEKIVRTAPVPVLVVHEYTALSKIKHIVFPTNLELINKNLLEKLKELQLIFNAKLHILYVKTPAEPESEKQIRKRLLAFVDIYEIENFTIHIRSAVGETNAILSFSSGLDDSMIAMGTRALTGLNHLILGSITEDVANHAASNVWTYALHGQTETLPALHANRSNNSP